MRFAVLGAGSWGTALAMLLAGNGHEVRLWGHRPEQVQRMWETHANEDYLPGLAFPQGIQPTASLSEALAEADICLVVVPSHAFRAVLEEARPLLGAEQRLAWATKGLELGSGKLLHQVAREVLGEDLVCAVISGPTFAKEVAAGKPAAVAVASPDEAYAQMLAGCLHNDHFRPYTLRDITGVELGGALKNVLAIAAGVADGFELGANTRAAIITRGLAEIMRLGEVLGASRETFMGLAGLGDLVLTCTDNQSRNRRFGLLLAQGYDTRSALAHIGQEVEGVKSAAEAHKLAARNGVEMPISEQVYRVIYEGVAPQAAIAELMAREPKAEML